MAELSASLTAIGPTGCGKSQLVWECYTRHAPRVVTLEYVRETMTRDLSPWPFSRRVYSFPELIDGLREVSRRRLTRWHFVASLDRDDTAALVRGLTPPDRSGDTKPLGVAVGGFVLSTGELPKLAPLVLPDDSPVLDLYERGRHFGVAVHGMTQHAARCNPCTRIQVNRVIFFRAVNTLGVTAVARASSPLIGELVADLPQYHSLTFLPNDGKAYLADDRYRVYRVLDYRGREDSLLPIRSGSAHSRADSPLVGAGRSSNGTHRGKSRLD